MSSASINGYPALILLFAVFIWYHFFFAPRKGAQIAASKGKDERRWNYYIWTFGIFAFIYLYLILDDPGLKEKRAVLGYIAGYGLIFIAAMCIDIVFKF